MDNALASIGKRIKKHGVVHLYPGELPNTILAIISATIDAPFTDMEVREYVYENRISLLVRTGYDDVRTITCRTEGRVDVVDDRDERIGWRIRLTPEDDENAELLRALVECIEIVSDEEFSRKSWTDFIESLSVHAPGEEPDPNVNPKGAHQFANEEFVEKYAVCDDPDEEIVWRDTVVPTLRNLGKDISHMSLIEALGSGDVDPSFLEDDVEEMIKRADSAFDGLWSEESHVLA